jgi:hypothetical protein
MLNLLSGRFGRRADFRANLLIARFSAIAAIRWAGQLHPLLP